MTIELKQLGTILQTRFDAASVREKMGIAWGKGEKLVLDFDKVEIISQAFADECFTKFLEEEEISYQEFSEGFIFKSASPVVRTRIDKAIR